MADSHRPRDFRFGYVAIVGRPNVGKSTLLNRLVGQKLSITSKKAQTTRHRITGVVTTDAMQIAFVDTPGFQTAHRSRLNDRMNRTVTQSLSDVDATVMVLEAGRTTAADRAVIRLLPKGARIVAVLNKVDRLQEKNALLPQIAELADQFPFAAIIPASAAKDEKWDPLLAEVGKLLPEGPPLFGDDAITDRDERFFASELIREKIFRLLGEEIPYSTTVVIDEFSEEGSLRRIHATIYVDRDNQKAIVLGKGGAQLKEIASAARVDMERMFGSAVFLEVWVRVKRNWANDETLLARFGY